MKALRIAAIMALMAALLLPTGAALAGAPSVNSIIINPNPPYQTSIWTDKANYSIGERISISFRVNRDAYAYVFSVDASGIVRLIFPNIYSSDNRVKANKVYALPDNSKYNLSIGGPNGTDQLVLISTPDKINDTDWLRRSLQQSSFAPQVNINIEADGFMAQIKSIVITPVFKNDWSSAYTTYTVGSGWIPAPTPVVPPIQVVPPVIVPPVSIPSVPMPGLLNGKINVTTNPSGVRIFINGQDQGTSPVNISNLKYGEYEITAVAPGYYTSTRRVQVAGAASQSVHISLERIVEKGYGTPVFTKIVDLGWPSSTTVSESFSYYGFSGTLTLRSESLLGMITKVQGLLQVQGSSQQLFTELTPTGPDAAFRNRVIEYYQRPFVVRITVINVNNVSGALTGTTYIESLRLYIEVFYLG